MWKWETDQYVRRQALDTNFYSWCSIYLHKNRVFTVVLLFPVMTLQHNIFYHYIFRKLLSESVFQKEISCGEKKEIVEVSLQSLPCCNSLWPWPSHWLGQRKEVSYLCVCGPTCLKLFSVWPQPERLNRKRSFTFNCCKKQTRNC